MIRNRKHEERIVSTTRECQQRRSRERQERELHRQRIIYGPSTDDFEHDAQREYDLIEGPVWENEGDPSYKF